MFARLSNSFGIGFGLLTVSVYAKPTNGVISWPQPTFVCLTVAFNILVTILIAQKMVASRKRLAEALPGRDMSAYTGVTAVLIESAIPLSVTGLGYAVLSAMSITGPGDPYVGVTFLNLFNLLYTSFNVSCAPSHCLSPSAKLTLVLNSNYHPPLLSSE